MQIYVGPQYPMKPPVIAFTNCINMDAVDARGVVIPEKVGSMMSIPEFFSILEH